MTSITELHAPRPRVAHRAVYALLEVVDSFSRAQTAANEYDALSNLTDKELEARGLDRRLIAHQAMNRHLDT